MLKNQWISAKTQQATKRLNTATVPYIILWSEEISKQKFKGCLPLLSPHRLPPASLPSNYPLPSSLKNAFFPSTTSLRTLLVPLFLFPFLPVFSHPSFSISASLQRSPNLPFQSSLPSLFHLPSSYLTSSISSFVPQFPCSVPFFFFLPLMPPSVIPFFHFIPFSPSLLHSSPPFLCPSPHPSSFYSWVFQFHFLFLLVSFYRLFFLATFSSHPSSLPPYYLPWVPSSCLSYLIWSSNKPTYFSLFRTILCTSLTISAFFAWS